VTPDDSPVLQPQPQLVPLDVRVAEFASGRPWDGREFLEPLSESVVVRGVAGRRKGWQGKSRSWHPRRHGTSETPGSAGQRACDVSLPPRQGHRMTEDGPHRGAAAAGAQALLNPATAVETIIASLSSARDLGSGTLANRTARMRWFASFAQEQGVWHLEAVRRGHVNAFVGARRASGEKATLSERHSRLAAVRLLYREARRLGLALIDPTLDIELPPRGPTSARPLTDAEVEFGRSYAVRKSDTRPAVCWALAEATTRTSEIPHIRVSDLDLKAGTVYIHGGVTTDPRTGTLTSWGVTQLRRGIRSCLPQDGPDPILMGSGRWNHLDNGRAAATMSLVATLKAARLAARDVNPRSIPAWAGAKALAGGASIDAVARMLGVRSLDQAAGIVGLQWREGTAT
jgi:site-specific recombinase XerD